MSVTPASRYGTLGGDQLFDRLQSTCYWVPDNISPAQVESVVHISCANFRLPVEKAQNEGLPDDGISEWFEDSAAAVLLNLASPLQLKKMPLKATSGELECSPVFSELFGGRDRWQLIRALLTIPEGQFLGTRKLAELSNIDSGNASRWLRRWASVGLVQVDPKTREYTVSPGGTLPVLKEIIGIDKG